MNKMTLISFILGILVGCVFGVLGLLYAWNNFGLFGGKPVNTLVVTTKEMALWQSDEICRLPVGTIMRLSSEGDPLTRMQIEIGIENSILVSEGPFFESVHDNSISDFTHLFPVVSTDP